MPAPITANQFRYVIDLDERGTFAATLYSIDSEGNDVVFRSIDTAEAQTLVDDFLIFPGGERTPAKALRSAARQMLAHYGAPSATVLLQDDEPQRDELESGCYFDGAHGQEYNDNRVLDLARQFGWVDAEDGLGRVDHLEEIEETDADELRGYAVEEAIEYLQDYAPEGHTVGWHDGDFGVWEDDEEADFDGVDFLHPGDSTEEDDPYHNG